MVASADPDALKRESLKGEGRETLNQPPHPGHPGRDDHGNVRLARLPGRHPLPQRPGRDPLGRYSTRPLCRYRREPLDITSIEYTIHLPCKTKALLAVGTPNWPTTLEKFTIVSDSTTGVYDTQTVVRTKYSGSAVTANLLVLPLLRVFPTVA
jgi:hypothetical protein